MRVNRRQTDQDFLGGPTACPKFGDVEMCLFRELKKRSSDLWSIFKQWQYYILEPRLCSQCTPKTLAMLRAFDSLEAGRQNTSEQLVIANEALTRGKKSGHCCLLLTASGTRKGPWSQEEVALFNSVLLPVLAKQSKGKRDWKQATTMYETARKTENTKLGKEVLGAKNEAQIKARYQTSTRPSGKRKKVTILRPMMP